jgi:hypothetical protein
MQQWYVKTQLSINTQSFSISINIVCVGIQTISRNGPFHIAALPPLSTQHTAHSTALDSNFLPSQNNERLQSVMSQTNQLVVFHLTTPKSSAN